MLAPRGTLAVLRGANVHVVARTGTNTVGKDADLLAVRGNPLEDIERIHDVVAVFAKGRRVQLAAAG